MAYGDLKVNNLIYDTGSGDATRTVLSIPQIASPTFTGNITINAQGDFRFADSDSSNYVGFQAPATVSSNLVWTLPAADGTSGQQLSTNGSGVLSWSDATNVAAASLSGTTIAANVVTSSLTTVGSLVGLAVNGTTTLNDDLILAGAAYNVSWDKSNNYLQFADNAKATFGAGNDLQINHNGTHSFLQHTYASGNLFIESAANIAFKVASTESALNLNSNGAVELYHNNVLKLTTSATGIDVTGTAVVDGFAIDGKAEQTAEALTAGSTVTIDCSTGNYFTLTSSGNTTFAFSNVPSSGTAYVCIIQVTAGSYSMTWPSAVKWPASTGGAAPTVTASKVHNFMLATTDGGTTWRANANYDYAS